MSWQLPCYIKIVWTFNFLMVAFVIFIFYRQSLLRSYSSCFVGREFVDWMIRVREAESRDEVTFKGPLLKDNQVTYRPKKGYASSMDDWKSQISIVIISFSDWGADQLTGSLIESLTSSLVGDWTTGYDWHLLVEWKLCKPTYWRSSWLSS